MLKLKNPEKVDILDVIVKGNVYSLKAGETKIFQDEVGEVISTTYAFVEKLEVTPEEEKAIKNKEKMAKARAAKKKK